MRRPGVHREASLPPHPCHIGVVKNDKREPETGFHFILPLIQHRRRAGDYDPVNTPAQKQLACNQACLNRLPNPDIICDEQIHTRQSERFPERFKLIGIDLNASAKWRLEEGGIRRGHTVP